MLLISTEAEPFAHPLAAGQKLAVFPERDTEERAGLTLRKQYFLAQAREDGNYGQWADCGEAVLQKNLS